MDTDTKPDINISYVAQLARLELEDDEKKRFQSDIKSILDYMKQLKELDVSDIEPMAHAVSLTDVYREDKTAPPFNRDNLLANAPQTVDEELIRVPVVLTGEIT